MTDESNSDEQEERPVLVTIGRLARVCPQADCNWRNFGDADAVCPSHGKSVSQPDRPYHGTKPWTRGTA